MADQLELPANWNGHRARVGGNRRRVRLSCDQLESRDATGNIISGVVAAAFGAPLSDSLSELARLIGDWAFLDATIRTSQPAGPMAPSADESPRKLTRYDTWLGPDLLFAEQRPERGARVMASPAPANPGRGAFGDLLGEPPHLSGPTNFGPFPSFVSVRAAAVFTPDSPPPARGVGNAIAAPHERILPEETSSSMMAAFTMDEPPNAAPVATNDSATVAEDGSVVIDVKANDSDPDGDDLAIDTWQYDPPYGTVTQEADGRLRYTPFPNFYGIDQFTYKVTDGRLTATGTVTVAVTSVNDAPVAFNDATAVTTAILEPDPAKIPIAVLGNDIDYDGGTLTVSALDTSMASGQGTLAIADDKLSVTWELPQGYSGETDFRYKVSDGQGGESGWADVHVWAEGDPLQPPPPLVTAMSDEFPIGDSPRSGNVLTNDSGGTIAVLASHPAGTRVTSFGFDGSVELTPTIARTDAAFEYVLFTSNGKGQATGTAKLVDVDLAIYDGQGGGKAIRGWDESKVGAVTVANMNDTDADGRADYEDMEVRSDPDNLLGNGKAYGVDEVDLMKVVVKRPANLPAGDRVTVRATHLGAGRQPMWYSSSIPDSLAPGDNVLSWTGVLSLGDSNFVNGFATVWLEARDRSQAVRDLSLDYTYGGATEYAYATAVWSEMTKFHGTGKTAGELVGLSFREDIARYNDSIALAFISGSRNGALGTGTMPFVMPDGTFYFPNGVEIEFTMYPTGVATERVKWDMSRSVEVIGRYWDATAGAWRGLPGPAGADKEFQPNRDKANDDLSPRVDEISIPIGVSRDIGG